MDWSIIRNFFIYCLRLVGLGRTTLENLMMCCPTVDFHCTTNIYPQTCLVFVYLGTSVLLKNIQIYLGRSLYFIPPPPIIKRTVQSHYLGLMCYSLEYVPALEGYGPSFYGSTMLLHNGVTRLCLPGHA